MKVISTAGFDYETTITKRGILIPSSMIHSGSKEEPESIGNGFNIQCDNVMSEVGYEDPIHVDDFAEVVIESKRVHNEFIKSKDINSSISYKAETLWREGMLAMDDRNLEFGCSPWKDINKEEEVTILPFDLPDPNMRFCGGHIHFGINVASEKDKLALIRHVDEVMYNSPALQRLMRSEPNRRNLYGKSGQYRDKDYGFEYRSLSSAWIGDDNMIHHVHNLIKKVNEEFKG